MQARVGLFNPKFFKKVSQTLLGLHNSLIVSGLVRRSRTDSIVNPYAKNVRAPHSNSWYRH